MRSSPHNGTVCFHPFSCTRKLNRFTHQVLFLVFLFVSHNQTNSRFHSNKLLSDRGVFILLSFLWSLIAIKDLSSTSFFTVTESDLRHFKENRTQLIQLTKSGKLIIWEYVGQSAPNTDTHNHAEVISEIMHAMEFSCLCVYGTRWFIETTLLRPASLFEPFFEIIYLKARRIKTFSCGPVNGTI